MRRVVPRAATQCEHMDLSERTTGEVLELSRATLTELRRRGVLRTGNAPAGDYAELLVQRAAGGELAPSSQKSWDVHTSAGERLQVKARVVTNPRDAGERQLSAFRSWDFDAGVVVLFADDFTVWRAARVPVAALQGAARWNKRTASWIVHARDELLELGEDWTERLRALT